MTAGPAMGRQRRPLRRCRLQRERRGVTPNRSSHILGSCSGHRRVRGVSFFAQPLCVCLPPDLQTSNYAPAIGHGIQASRCDRATFGFIVLKALTASAARDPANERCGVVNFTADAHYYTFVLDRTALRRLSRQIEHVLVGYATSAKAEDGREERNERAPGEETPLMAYRRGDDVTPSRSLRGFENERARLQRSEVRHHPLSVEFI